MKVWIDGIVFERTSQFGIWRVFYETMLRSRHEIDYTLWLRNVPRQPLPAGIPVVMDQGRTEAGKWNLARRAKRKWSNSRLPRQLRQADLFHTSGVTLSPLPELKYLVTIHDMIEEHFFPISISAVEQAVQLKRQAIEAACLIPCVSQSTLNDVNAFYPDARQRTRLIYNGANHSNWKSVEASSTGPRTSGDVLFMGQRVGYENFYTIIEAMRHPEWPPGVQLAVLGPAFSEAEQLLLRKLGVHHRVRRLERLSEPALQALYQSAVAMICPSYLEGFGLPMVEAQGIGCPVICSDIPVFREVAGEAALFFDPRLGEELAARLADLVSSSTLRGKLIEAGWENCRRFTWEQAASRLLSVYQEAYEARSKR